MKSADEIRAMMAINNTPDEKELAVIAEDIERAANNGRTHILHFNRLTPATAYYLLDKGYDVKEEFSPELETNWLVKISW